MQWTPGKQLKRWRSAVKKRAVDVAKELGVTQQTVSNWEGDLNRPHISKATQIEKLYELPPGVVTLLLSGVKPPVDAVDPDLVGVQDGRPVWSARFFIEDTSIDAIQDLHTSYDVELAIAADGDLDDEQREMLKRVYRTLKIEKTLRPSPEPEPEGP